MEPARFGKYRLESRECPPGPVDSHYEDGIDCGQHCLAKSGNGIRPDGQA